VEDEKKDSAFLWRFGDSPFTWGGLGVIAGSALASPTWFKFAFVGGGIAIAIGLLRARPFTFKCPAWMVAANTILVLSFVAVWWLLWTVIPKPVECLTKQEAVDFLKASRAPALPSIQAIDDGTKPITKADFMKLLAQYLPAKSTAPKLTTSTLGNLSSDILVKTVGPVTGYLRDFQLNGWYGADHNIELFSAADYEKEQWRKENPIWNPSRTQEEWKDEQRKIDDSYRSQLMQLLSDADALRVALKNKLPKEAQTPEDDAQGAAFARAKADAAVVRSGLECCPASIRNASDYLDALAKRVSRIKTLQNWALPAI